MNKDDLLKLENQLCFPLYVASRLVTKIYQPFLSELEITYPQYLVLMTLWEQDHLTVNQITHKLYLQTNTVTPLLQRMEKQGLISKSKSKEDTRSYIVSLSDKGKELKEQAHCIPESLLKENTMDQEELQLLKTTLDKLIHHLDEKK
ncbi:MarR family transcriptional regulator [Flammeovirga yaeyamensis]|uniref:HTH-type transcriptional regulator SarZ n=1 Tax=Flammeovirga yaeyamensis TaxID=367791 RepID=A0AAX1N3U4_9BACT|nr:MarR family transcriptional regulator [Flammeovirga yaeyamensis]MBB3699585.1 DNA-binding MarR family transcriptional regulator [Flammeovirga yaeyamensis]NMF36842.1 MarR family transcriptional regulator [Flammeovirga yaeyamensis]QWG02119.1 MarR family transcriptional regulator [Flammeovirga yaeyamensis]